MAPRREGGAATSRPRASAAVLAALAAVACGGDADDATTRTTVTFVYAQPVAIDPGVAAQFPDCVAGVDRTHIHPSWRGFARVDLIAEGDRWTITFDDVPVGTRERIRVSDPNACARHPTGASTRDVLANGVLLSDVVDTPGAGTEPGLALTAAVDGTVTP